MAAVSIRSLRRKAHPGNPFGLQGELPEPTKNPLDILKQEPDELP